jgi:predicted nucleotidyltransferase
MLSEKDKIIAKQFKEKLIELTPLVRVLVYGSRARGDSSPDSDMDIYIEIPRLTQKMRRNISELAWEVGYENGIIISTFVVTLFDIEEGPVGANPLVRVVNTEGIPI